jgi:hypothetical protein
VISPLTLTLTIDQEYREDPAHYGVAWEDLDDMDLQVEQHQGSQQQSNDLSPSEPPYWSEVIVESPVEGPFTQEQVTELEEYLDQRIGRQDFSMDVHRQRWTFALQHH